MQPGERAVALDVPLSAFTGLPSRTALAPMVLSGDVPTVFVDNVYFYKVAVPQAPTTAAPTPS